MDQRLGKVGTMVLGFGRTCAAASPPLDAARRDHRSALRLAHPLTTGSFGEQDCRSAPLPTAEPSAIGLEDTTKTTRRIWARRES
ncbi:hypothetical protein JKG68_26985 [Microvirga aerilata]|uniref:Uncharacterized protein n=1 Tax=Microvirga aerilata TaxID=670292 RepID=A0A937D372_9HYPH|nr:hypothetical protein [Microvirga aerilata]MBL0407567.1 hypothetical protein [Microvirga aerilata]